MDNTMSQRNTGFIWRNNLGRFTRAVFLVILLVNFMILHCYAPTVPSHNEVGLTGNNDIAHHIIGTQTQNIVPHVTHSHHKLSKRSDNQTVVHPDFNATAASDALTSGLIGDLISTTTDFHSGSFSMLAFLNDDQKSATLAIFEAALKGPLPKEASDLGITLQDFQNNTNLQWAAAKLDTFSDTQNLLNGTFVKLSSDVAYIKKRDEHLVHNQEKEPNVGVAPPEKGGGASPGGGKGGKSGGSAGGKSGSGASDGSVGKGSGGKTSGPSSVGKPIHGGSTVSPGSGKPRSRNGGILFGPNHHYYYYVPYRIQNSDGTYTDERFVVYEDSEYADSNFYIYNTTLSPDQVQEQIIEFAKANTAKYNVTDPSIGNYSQMQLETYTQFRFRFPGEVNGASLAINPWGTKFGKLVLTSLIGLGLFFTTA